MVLSHNYSRIPVPLGVIGAGRGSHEMQPFIQESNNTSQTLRFDPFIVDRAPGKALALAKRGREVFGLNTSFREAAGEDYLAQSKNHSPAVVAIDDPGAIKRIIEMGNERSLFIYILIQPPFGGLTGWKFLLPPEEKELKRRLADFFQQLSDVTAPGSTQEVFESPENNVTEDLYRQSFAKHFQKNITKVVNHLQPESPLAEATFDGRQTSQVEVMDSQQGWRTSEQLLHDLQSSLQIPVRRGTNFAILETSEDGIRIHQVRYRMTDGRFALKGMTSINEESVHRAELNRLNAALIAE